MSANTTSQINDAITWAKEENLRLVIRGGDDAIHVADRLRAEGIPVILTSTMDAPGRDHEGYDAAYSRAARLYEAGVKFAISGGSGSLYTDRLPYEAGVAVARRVAQLPVRLPRRLSACWPHQRRGRVCR